MPQTYEQWLKAKNRPRTRTSANAFRAARGLPALKKKGGTNLPLFQQGYRGYAGATDPSYGGTPLGLPADAGRPIWTGRNNPDLQSIAAGGYEQLVPRQRKGGGWDVYGVPTDPTPQWGKDYLSSLKSREQRHMGYVDQQVAPWLANVLGSAQTVNTEAQTGLANMISRVNMGMANVATPNAAPVGMTGGGSGAGSLEDIASAQAAQGQAGARIGSSAYQAALSNLTVGTSADQQNAALAQARLRLPGQYEQMRMDFSTKLGEITEQIRENQRAREFQRQQLLETRRQFGLTFAEQRRAARAGEEIQRGALDIQASEAAFNQSPLNPDNQPEDVDRRDLRDIRSGLTESERVVAGGRGFATREEGMRATRGNKKVQWEQATNGKWYGVLNTEAGSAGGSESAGDYRKRYREYVGNIPSLFTGKGKYVTVPGGGTEQTWQAEPGTRMSFIDVARDMLDIHDFNPSDVVKALRPSLANIRRKDPKLYQQRLGQFVNMIAPRIPGNLDKKSQAVATLFGLNRYEVRKLLGGTNPDLARA